MTEKRFTYRYNGDCESEWEIIDLDDDAYYGMDTTENCVKSLVELLNELFDENEQLKQQLQEIQNSFELNWTQNYEEFNKDKLYLKDTNTKLCLDGTNLLIEVYIPQIKEYYRFKYMVTGRRLMREVIENYNSKVILND